MTLETLAMILAAFIIGYALGFGHVWLLFRVHLPIGE